jgi:hypothetical protein
MISHEQAERIAAQFVGAPASDPHNGWDMEEFDAGWLVLKHATRNLRGGGSYVVERESGRVLHFPSYVSPGRILEEYDQVVDRGFPEDIRPATLRLRLPGLYSLWLPSLHDVHTPFGLLPVGRLRRSPRRLGPSRAGAPRGVVT